MTWERERTYTRTRAAELMDEMEEALASTDRERFKRVWQVATRYMPKKQRQPYYERFLAQIVGTEEI